MKHIKLYEANWDSDKYSNPGYLAPEDIGEPGEMIVAWADHNGNPGVALCTQEQALQLEKTLNNSNRLYPYPQGVLKIMPAEGMAYVTFGPYPDNGSPREIQALPASKQNKTSAYEVFVSSAYPIQSRGSNVNPSWRGKSGSSYWTTYASTLKRGYVLYDEDMWNNNYGSADFNYTEVEKIPEYIDRYQIALRERNPKKTKTSKMANSLLLAKIKRAV